MIDQLFGSKTRVKLLQLFYSNPNRSFYVREITRKIDEQINSVRRELANLLSIGIISSDTNNKLSADTNRLYYEVNQAFEYYGPLAAIFGEGVVTSSDTATVSDADAQTLKTLGNVDLALLTGQFTRDERSGADLLLIGDVNQTQVAKYVSELEAKEGKEVRYVVMDLDEFHYRKEVNDRFLDLVLASKSQILVDRNNLLTPVVEEPAKPTKKKAAKEEK